MEAGLLHLHNFLRWIVVVLLIVTIVKSMSGLGGNKAFTNGDRKTALFLMISVDVQLLLGIVLYFTRNWNEVLTGGGFMKMPVQRFWAMEHAVGMIIAIALVHIGYAATKSNKSDGAKFKKLFWCTLLALIVAAAVMPWPFRIEGIAKPWFPGM